MPFIDCRTSVALSARTRERIKTRFGQAISALKKPESMMSMTSATSSAIMVI